MKEIYMRKIMTNAKAFAVSLAMAGIVIAPLAASAQLNTSDIGLEYAANIGLGTRDVRDTIVDIIRIAMSLLGIVAVVIILFGGFKWMTSGGDTTKVEDAKKLIYAGIIGLIIIFSAFAISQFVLSKLLQTTSA